MADDGTKKIVGCIYTCGFIYLIGEIGGLIALSISKSDDKDLIYLIIIVATLLLAISIIWWTNIEKNKHVSIANQEKQEWKNKAWHVEKDFKIKEKQINL